MLSDKQKLDQAIRTMLLDAQVSAQKLPECPQISLWLVEPETMRRPFSQEEINNIQENPAYWAFCWASGQVLARMILARPEWVAGKKVMDFGAGSGVVAIACALAGAKEIIACDIDQHAMTACQANAALNSVQLRTHNDLFNFNEPLDILFAADVLYDQANLPLLDAFISKAQEVVVADSRIKDFDYPPYRPISCSVSSTVPDLDEIEEFRKVTLYRSSSSS